MAGFGLDTRGMMDGFAQGFGLMQNYQDSKDRKAYLQQQQDIQQRGLQMREQEFAAQQEDRQEQKDLQFAQNWWQQAFVASETQNPDMFPAWDEETQARLTRSGMPNPSHLLRPETEAAVQYADRLAKGEGSLFSKQTVEAMNDFYAPRVNRGNGGNKRLAPMTVNRGVAGEDDEIAQYSIEDAIKPVIGVKQLYGAFGKNMDFVRKMGRMQGWLPEEAERWETQVLPDGTRIQVNQYGEEKLIQGRAPQPKDGRSAREKLIERYQLENPGTSFNDALAATGGIPDEQKLGLQLLNQQIKELDSKTNGAAGLKLEESEFEALQQERAALVAQRAELTRSMGLFGTTGQQPAPQPQQAQQVGKSQRIAGKVYRDANGNRAKFAGYDEQGNERWEAVGSQSDQPAIQPQEQPARELTQAELFEQQLARAVQLSRERQMRLEEARKYQPVTAKGTQAPAEQARGPWNGVGLSPSLIPR